jgi:hypothetical protein
MGFGHIIARLTGEITLPLLQEDLNSLPFVKYWKLHQLILLNIFDFLIKSGLKRIESFELRLNGICSMFIGQWDVMT